MRSLTQPIHPVPITIFSLTILFPRVGLPRTLCLKGSLTAALFFFQGLGPKRPESCDGNWVYVAGLPNSKSESREQPPQAPLRSVGAPESSSPRCTNIVRVCAVHKTGKRDSIHHHLLDVILETATVPELRQKLLHTNLSGWWWWWRIESVFRNMRMDHTVYVR